MKRIESMAATCGTVFCLTMSATSWAAPSISPEKMTCKEFVALDDVVKPNVVYWTDGFGKKGKRTDSVIDVEETDKLVPILVTECKEAPSATLMQKIKSHPIAPQQPAPVKQSVASQSPTRMTCAEFVALDDVAKPKVVYWAEGFNKKGKALDTVVDVDETNRLVPVLITECKESPKLSFWQKFEKHL
jgi:hypothetical protein